MKQKIPEMFWQGRLSSVIRLHEQLASKKTRQSEHRITANSPEIIGSYVFYGDLNQAQAIFDSHSQNLDPEQTASCWFFLIVGNIRESSYKRAKNLLSELKQLAKAHPSSDFIQFYHCQGEAFYRVYRSKYSEARRWSTKAVTISQKIAFKFGNFIARDLLGGCLIQLGEISLGIKELERALSGAYTLGNGSFAATSLISLTCRKIKFGYVEKPIPLLKSTLQQIKTEDTYSKSELKLELINQYLLRGEIKNAEAILQESSELIYANQNLRQASALHLRWSFLMYCRGQFHQALAFIQVAERSLDKKSDQLFLAKLFGLRLKVLTALNLPLSSDNKHLGDSIDLRTINRHSQNFKPAKAGEDRIADIADLIAQSPRKLALAAVVKSGAWYFLADILNLRRQKSYLIFGIEKPGSLTIFHEGEIKHSRREIGANQFRLLQLLAKSPMTKEVLVKSIWEYNYSPDRHDNMVYSTVSALRKYMGNFGIWIEMTDDQYTLRSNLTLLIVKPQQSQSTESKDELPGTRPSMSPEITAFDVELNFRQNSWLSDRSSQIAPFGVNDYQNCFSISTMTAYRDIRGLLQLAYLRRTGFGRATRYYFIKADD